MKWLVRLGIGVVSLVVLLVVGVMMLPPPEMPKPDGPHKVGITEFEVSEGEHLVHVMLWFGIRQLIRQMESICLMLPIMWLKRLVRSKGYRLDYLMIFPGLTVKL
ncbi:hypothetical protein [uncultured Photobacterium sp.]|uniref:hypothetical protein n=1 Tax=uncultured Photobacterium sp. TaxID=173973 RepID=UPI0026248A07|nr:hypothetical protein [uncultured Photobacterium sp.]